MERHPLKQTKLELGGRAAQTCQQSYEYDNEKRRIQCVVWERRCTPGNTERHGEAAASDGLETIMLHITDVTTLNNHIHVVLCVTRSFKMILCSGEFNFYAFMTFHGHLSRGASFLPQNWGQPGRGRGASGLWPLPPPHPHKQHVV